MTIIRKTSAAGKFYPRFGSELKKSINESFLNKKFGTGKDLEVGEKEKGKKRQVLGGICPHAGYIYSGPALSFTIQEIFKEGAPDTIIILGTTHTGYDEIGLMLNGLWETPFGKVEIDSELGELLLKNSKVIIEDDSAFNGYPHAREHCIEVQIPFIQYAAQKAKKRIKILPIKIGNMDPKKFQILGKNIAKAISLSKDKDIAIFASSDFTHYEPKQPRNPKKEIFIDQYQKDKAVMDSFELFDWKRTFKNATKTSVCGAQTISTLMIVGKELNYSKAKKLKYYTSFEKSEEQTPCSYSVGYFSGVISD